MGRFDVSFKSLGENSPLTLIRLFGHTPVDAATRIEPVERELAMSIKSVDQAFILRRGEEMWIEHFEAEIELSANDLQLILKRADLLGIKYDAPVWTTIVQLSRRRAAANLPKVVTAVRGGIRVEMTPHIVCLWETPPGLVLQDANVDALPLVGGMKTTPEEFEIAKARMDAVADREHRSRLGADLVTWCGLSYNEDVVTEIRARFSMVTMKDVMMASSIGEELVAYGREEGREEGQMIVARAHAISLADSRFPGLLNHSRVLAMNDLEALQRIFRAFLTATDREQVRAAVGPFLNS